MSKTVYNRLDLLEDYTNVLSDALTATGVEINRACDVSARIVNLTAATLSVTTALHDGKIITINKADGSAITLPAATGSGSIFKFFVGTTVTSSAVTIKVADGSDVMFGQAVMAIDGGTTNNFFLTAADSDTISLNGSTTGGYKGDYIELIDVAENTYRVLMTCKATGTEATPFSATVS